MKRAFLCYSSVDKHYVDIVAKKLGRAKVLYDKISFTPGQDFRSEILKYLDRASLFVFFASTHSLQSTWCKFELAEAEFRILGSGIEGQLTIIIDQSVTHADLPKWMQFTKAVLQPRPSQASRDIEAALYSLLPEMFKPPFVGRSNQISEFVQGFSSRRPAPQVIILTGLDGVGRRTYLDRCCKDNLGLTLGPFFLYDETKRLEDVYLWLFNETDDLTTRAEIRDELSSFSRLSLHEQVFELDRRLEMLCRDNCIPCLVDYGGLLSDLGEYRVPVAELLRQFVKPKADRYLALIHQRSPRIKETEFIERSFQQSVPPLDANETRLLIQQLLRRENIVARDDQVSELIDYLGGYPPAAYLAAMHSKNYGLDILLADKSVLTDFQAKRFTGLINKLNLSDKEWFILRYLSAELIVPLSVVALAADVELADAAIMLRNLIEQSLVIVVNDQYGLSFPIRNAIERVKGNLSSEDYKPICARLTAEFWEGEHAAPSIEIVDATLHAVARTGSVDLQPYSDLVRVSIIHRLALECYYRREWQNALAYTERAVAMDPRSYELLELHFKILVRLERYVDAKAKLSEIQSAGARNYYYLKGFFHRFQRQHKEAIESFKAAEALGHRSQALLRDYADCLHRIGNNKEALAKIEMARKREPADIFVLELVHQDLSIRRTDRRS
jgi:TIR domain.